MDQADVVIVGGAVMGASAAYWLTRMAQGLRVMVVERDPSFARAATALSVASIRQQFSTGVNVAISAFGIGFIRDFQGALGRDVGIASLGFRENGYLFLGQSAEAPVVMAELAALQRAHGAATEVWMPDQIKARFPWLEVGDLTAGSFGVRDEGWFDNMGLLAGFRAAAKAQGAVFVTGEVVGLRMAGDRVQAAVLTDRVVSCGAVVNAAGTRASVVARMAGIDLPVEPRKRTVFVIDAPNARHPEAPLLVDAGFYLRPEQQHWITATVPQDDCACEVNDFDPDLHLFEDVIWPQLYARAPGFDAVKVIRHWVGHYDYNTLDQNALLGPHPSVRNLYFMNGFSGHGLQQAPAVGRGVAEHILHGDWQSLDLSDLSVDRVVMSRAFLERAVV
ncbi:MAG: NAD(P)/FAD-dependent oxidoreductase [Paracoccaceae bacterium]